MKTHMLKCWPEYFKQVKAGTKTFGIRENDRDYQVGDVLYLQEFEPCDKCLGRRKAIGRTTPCSECGGNGGKYTLDAHAATVYAVFSDLPGLKHGYVILDLNPRRP